MINLKKLRNNQNLALNISELKGLLKGGRALVLSENIPYINDQLTELGNVPFYITDYFNIVIAENEHAIKCLPWADILFYQNDSAYFKSVMKLESYSSYANSLLCTNFNAISQIKKLNRVLKMYNINYLPFTGSPKTSPAIVRNVSCGLSTDKPGVHLAQILGCTEIMYNPTDLDKFIIAKKPKAILPFNLIRPNRKPFIKSHL